MQKYVSYHALYLELGKRVPRKIFSKKMKKVV